MRNPPGLCECLKKRLSCVLRTIVRQKLVRPSEHRTVLAQFIIHTIRLVGVTAISATNGHVRVVLLMATFA